MSLAVQSVERWEFHGRDGTLKHQEDISQPWRTEDNEKCLGVPLDDTPCNVVDPSSPTESSKYEAGKQTILTTRLPQKSVRKDKIAFVLGVLHFWVCVYWFGSYPHSFYKLYSVESFVLFPIRWKSFKKMKMHYYMFDFCYVANLLLLIFLWIFPRSAFLSKVLFAYNSGPLAWSIVLFKNSMVYHSLSEVTSLFLHYYPMLVSWTLRWYPDCALHDICDTAKEGWWFDSRLSHFLLWPMAPYFAWAVFYYLKLFVVSSKKIRDRDYQTLYKYMVEGEAQFPLLQRIIFRFSPPWRPLIYMCIHLMLVFLSLLGCTLMWNSFWMHSTWLAIATLYSAWNGASYYFY